MSTRASCHVQQIHFDRKHMGWCYNCIVVESAWQGRGHCLTALLWHYMEYLNIDINHIWIYLACWWIRPPFQMARCITLLLPCMMHVPKIDCVWSLPDARGQLHASCQTSVVNFGSHTLAGWWVSAWWLTNGSSILWVTSQNNNISIHDSDVKVKAHDLKRGGPLLGYNTWLESHLVWFLNSQCASLANV